MKNFNFKESVTRNSKVMCKEFCSNTVYRVIGYCIGTAFLVGFDAVIASKPTRKEVQTNKI